MPSSHQPGESIQPGRTKVHSGRRAADVLPALRGTSKVYGSFGFRAVIYFAANPDEELLTRDLILKLGSPGYGAQAAMRQAIDGAWLDVKPCLAGQVHGSRNGYIVSAGPKLRQALGLK